ncbi:hypothetical protein KEM55_008427 [Ascosphaera atra]|nr:hypothetical protein KEM55_008427 [Ascosphaera atra]
MSERQISYGRGGAGNIAAAKNMERPQSKDLETPTIKADVYTTGRGGSGNMVANNDPKIARIRQDVEAPPSLTNGKEGDRKILLGRGGAANLYSPPQADEESNTLQKSATNASTAHAQAAGDETAEEAARAIQRPPMAHLNPE